MTSRPPRRGPGRRQSHAPAVAESSPTLPAWRAFLVQFTLQSGGGSAVLSGRVEHLNSGRRARFDSKEELLAALSRLLATIDEPERQD